MLAVDETALICDFAQYYGVLNYRTLPVPLAAALAAGLDEDSRSCRKQSETTSPVNTMLLAGIFDRLSTIGWLQTKDGQNGRNHPKSILSILTGNSQEETEFSGFDTPEEYEAAKTSILGVST